METTPQDPIDGYIQRLIEREGGFVDHPDDRGGPTRYGITLATLANWKTSKVDASDIRTLKKSEAAQIYRHLYFISPRIDKLPQPIQEQMLDASVHHGPRRAVMFLQKILNQAGFGPLDLDGVIGSQTCAAAREADARMGDFLGNAIADERVIFFRKIITSDPRQGVFYKGWKARAQSFKVEVHT